MPHLLRRQGGDPLPVPTGLGITNAITASTETSTVATLAFDASLTDDGGLQTAPDLAITSTPVVTLSSSTHPSLTSATLLPSTTPSATSDTSAPISMSTVVGTCVGAFIGATALICLALWFYRRYYRSLKKRAQSRHALPRRRVNNNEGERRRSHLEPWNKLDDGHDKWEGTYQAKEIDNVAPMEKLTMFKKSPSVRTAWTHKSDELPSFAPQAFAQFHPSIAESLASKKDNKSIHDESATLVLPNHPSSTAPALHMAIPTPAAVQSQLHRWESAEVIQYDVSHSSAQDPFEDTAESRKSLSNPFFNAQGHSSKSEPRSRSNSKSAVVPALRLNKAKDRAAEPQNPFSDDHVLQSPNLGKHVVSESQSSVASQERALQSLIAALDISPAEAQERLRVASMQPSMISEMSAYTDVEEDFTASFPQPPSTPTRPKGTYEAR